MIARCPEKAPGDDTWAYAKPHRTVMREEIKGYFTVFSLE